MRLFLLSSLFALSGFAATTVVQNSGCPNDDTSTLTATLASTVTAGHTLLFFTVGTNSSPGVIGTYNTPTDGDSNVYTSLKNVTLSVGGINARRQLWTATAAHTVSSLTITATVAGTITASGTCAIEVSTALSTVLDATSSSASGGSSNNVGCTATGSAPNTTVTPPAGSTVLYFGMAATGGAGRAQFTITTQAGATQLESLIGHGDNIGFTVNSAGWGLGYIPSAAGSTTYTVGFTTFPGGNNAGWSCDTVVLNPIAATVRHRSVPQ